MELPKEFIIYDLEYTAWEGSKKRNWSGENEHREIIQIGAIKVNEFQESESFLIHVKPKINPVLSDFIISLTSITQEEIDTKGMSLEVALGVFLKWSAEFTLCSFGSDNNVMKENCTLYNMSFPFKNSMFINLRPFFEDWGIDTEIYFSGSLPEAYGLESPSQPHNALNDARSILIALKAEHEGKNG